MTVRDPKNANIIQFRVLDTDTEIREAFNDIGNALFNEKGKVCNKDIIRELVRRANGRSDELVIPSQKGLISEIRRLLDEYQPMRQVYGDAQTPYDLGEFLDDLSGTLDQYGVEIDD